MPADVGDDARPRLLAVGDTVLVRAQVVTVLATGCRVKVAGMTAGLTAYFSTDHSNISLPAPETP